MNRTLDIINELENSRVRKNISKESIEFIFNICKSINANNVLEIGTFNGYSALWFSLCAKNVISLEFDKTSVDLANSNLDKAGVKNVKVVYGDALETLKNINERFDVVLIDAMKKQYKDYLVLSLKLLNENGVIFADNTISHKEDMKSFFDYLENSDLYYKELNIGRGLLMITKLDPEKLAWMTLSLESLKNT